MSQTTTIPALASGWREKMQLVSGRLGGYYGGTGGSVSLQPLEQQDW